MFYCSGTVYFRYYFMLVSVCSIAVRESHTLQSGPPDICSPHRALHSCRHLTDCTPHAGLCLPTAIHNILEMPMSRAPRTGEWLPGLRGGKRDGLEGGHQRSCGDGNGRGFALLTSSSRSWAAGCDDRGRVDHRDQGSLWAISYSCMPISSDLRSQGRIHKRKE